MLFKLTNQENDRQTHAGVLEFVADEGKVYLPHWVRISSPFNLINPEINVTPLPSLPR